MDTFNSPQNIRLSKRQDLVCFSHLRWDFVYQRPQHLMSRFAKDRRVFFVEEPSFHTGGPNMEVSRREDGMHIVVPYLPEGTAPTEGESILRKLLGSLFAEQNISECIFWFYTPMMFGWVSQLTPRAVVYDCMDELSAFRNAPLGLIERESELMSTADLVFTGGRSLYEAKRERHPSVHCFPSSIDARHFETARSVTNDPVDQNDIPHPRIGFFGVIDERSDLDLLEKIADLRPDWHYIMLGPVVKIDPADLPQRENVHYLGHKKYQVLPDYVGGWDVAMMPFALNESTRFISPTKTPEYLAAGLPVVSTPVKDVARPYGEEGLVRIAETPEEFVTAIENAMAENDDDRLRRVDEFLREMSWDKTYEAMLELLEKAAAESKDAVAATVV